MFAKWKRLFLLFMLLLIPVGCKKDVEHVKETVKEPITEVKDENKEQMEIVSDDTTHTDIKENTPIKEENKSQPADKKQEIKEETTTSQTTKEPSVEESKKEEPKKEEITPPKKEVVTYNPDTVVSLATEKTKAKGKILLTENLDKLLAEGTITKEEYDAYYPYDGAGYYSIYVETNLKEASTTSGRRLETVDGIATYLSETLALEPGPYFLIEYAGVYRLNGTEFYEFRCYRA